MAKEKAQKIKMMIYLTLFCLLTGLGIAFCQPIRGDADQQVESGRGTR